MKAERIGVTHIGDTKRSAISSASEFKKSNFSERSLQSAPKNGRGDNAHVIPKEKRRKESVRKGEKRDDASVKVVPLHINDVIDALKYCQKSSLTAVMQNCSRRKLEEFSGGKISGKHRRFHNQEEISDIESRFDTRFNGDEESTISDFVEELNIRYIRKCESEVKKRKIKRRKTLGHQQPKKWPKLKDKKLSEKNSRTKKRTSHHGSYDMSSLTMLSYLPSDQIEACSKVGKHSSRKIRHKHSKIGSKHRSGDFEAKSTVSDVNPRRRRKMQSKSYTAHKESDAYEHLKRNEPVRGIYSSKSQESTYKIVHPMQKRLRKNRLEAHRRERRLHGRRDVPTSEQEDLDSTETIGKRLDLPNDELERSEKESAEKLISKEIIVDANPMPDWDREAKTKAEIFERLSGRDGKTFNDSLANFSERESKENIGKINYNTFLNSAYNYKTRGGCQGAPVQSNYEKIILGQSDNLKENSTLENTGIQGSKTYDRINSDMTNQFTFEVNLQKNFQTNERSAFTRYSDTSLIQQSSKIIFKTGTSQTEMHNIPSDSQIFKGNGRNLEKMHLPTDSYSLNMIPPDTFNKRYRKNRLNGDFGILSRISVPDFHQKEVLTAKNFRRPKQNKYQPPQNENNKSSNDPLKNIMLTQLVRQNSALSLQKETRVDIKQRYLLGDLSKDTLTKPVNTSDGCSLQRPNSASPSDPTPYGRRANLSSDEEDSDSSLSESVIIRTMNQKQSKTDGRKSSTALKENDQHPNKSDGSNDEKTSYHCSSSLQGHAPKQRACPHQHKERQHECLRMTPPGERVTYSPFYEEEPEESCPHQHKERQHECLRNTPEGDRVAYSPPFYEENPEQSGFKTIQGPKKCAVSTCNKHAVLDLEQAIEMSKKRACKLKGVDKKPNTPNTCPHRKMVGSSSSHQICLSCNAPLTEQNSKTQPGDGPKHLIPTTDNFQLPESFPSHLDDVPFFRSPSQEDFQQYVSRMRPCFSPQHTAQHTHVKKYHTMPPPTPLSMNPNKYHLPNYWDSGNCAHAPTNCTNHSFANQDSLAYYCTEDIGADYDLQQEEDCEPFPFMQSTRPLVDMSGRPLLILDGNGRPLMNYDGHPMLPDCHVHEDYQFNPDFQTFNEFPLEQDEFKQSNKFSCFGFH